MLDTVDNDDIGATVAFTKIEVVPVDEHLVKVLTWYRDELVSIRYTESFTYFSDDVSFVEKVS